MPFVPPPRGGSHDVVVVTGRSHDKRLAGPGALPNAILPNFLVIGAMRSGTTALYFGLKEHPQIYMPPVKEPTFFGVRPGERVPLEGSHVSATTIAEYADLFAAAVEPRVGEASQSYLHLPEAPRDIQRTLDPVKLIAILRNPVDRAFSHYLWNVRQGREEISDFRAALAAEPARAKTGSDYGHYVARSRYHQPLARYFEMFGRDQLAVFLYDQLVDDPIALLQSIYAFLDVDPAFAPNTIIRRVPSGLPKNRLLNSMLTRATPVRKLLEPVLPSIFYRVVTRIRDWNLRQPQLSDDLRERLTDEFRDDIRQLETLIGKDLSHWLN